jgi:hypothetical protein
MESNYLEDVRKQFRYYRKLGEQAMDQLDPEQLFVAANPDSNSIAVIAGHLAGNMLSRWTDFLTSDGEKSWRDRDAEFEVQFSGREDLRKRWNEDGIAFWRHSINSSRPIFRRSAISVMKVIPFSKQSIGNLLITRTMSARSCSPPNS